VLLLTQRHCPFKPNHSVTASNTDTNGLSCSLLNARSVANKLEELHYLLYMDKYDLLFITETWLSPNLPDGCLDPNSHYLLLRKDRASGHGGGVCVFVHKGLHVTPVELADTYNHLELLCFDLYCVTAKLRFFCVYRPPHNDSEGVEYLTLITRCVTAYSVGQHINVILGDLNCPNVNWSTRSGSSDCINSTLLKFADKCGFHQFVDFATRGNNILDVILSDDPQLISTLSPAPPLGRSDHVMIKFHIDHFCHSSQQEFSKSLKYNWYKGDFTGIANFIASIDWHYVLCNYPSACVLWYTFVDILWSAVRLFVPVYKSNGAQNKARKHYPANVRRLATKKLKAWRQYRNSPSDVSLEVKYTSCVKAYRHAVLQHESNVESRIIDADNVGSFYKFITNRMSHRTNIGTLVEPSGKVVVTDSDKANLFNTYFASVGVVDNGKPPKCDTMTDVGCKLDTVLFTERNVTVAIDKLKNNLSCGPDELPPLLFKRLKHCLARPLALVYTQLLSVAFVPDEWKQAVIIPVFKKGTTGDVSNYRPISLTCVVCKIMERVISHQILEYLLHNKLLHPAQHGFVPQRSTCTNLIECMYDWTLSVQYKRTVSVAYIDFSKAFDSVSHKKLFAKLAAFGISGTLLGWIKNFLINRSHQTKVGVSLSDIVQLISGVVQGSGLGPLLFLIYINDLVHFMEQYHVTLRLFADDVKVYIDIVNTCDADELQNALNALAVWADTWQLSVSVQKCCILNIGNSLLANSPHIDGSLLPVVTSCRDLGITVSSDLSFTEHITGIVSRANFRANAIRRCFVSRDRNLLVRAFTVYVRPILEYNSVVWSPSLLQDIIRIEQVQRRFTKYLPGFQNLPYNERLRRLKLTSLERRRLVTDLLMCYKIVFGLITLHCSNLLQLNLSSRPTRGHKYKLLKYHCGNGTTASFFGNRVINVWNSLPPSAVDFSSLGKFKKSLASLDLTSHLHCYNF